MSNIAPTVSLDDKYTLKTGRAWMTGIQALVRLPMMQKLRDEAAGLNTAGFVTGYRGSPLGSVDQEFWKAKQLPRADATSASSPGSTRTSPRPRCGARSRSASIPNAKYDGVFSIWYGKGPGRGPHRRRLPPRQCRRHLDSTAACW